MTLKDKVLSVFILLAIVGGVSHSVVYLSDLHDNIIKGSTFTSEMREYGILIVLDIFLVATIITWVLSKLERISGEKTD